MFIFGSYRQVTHLTMIECNFKPCLLFVKKANDKNLGEEYTLQSFMGSKELFFNTILIVFDFMGEKIIIYL